MPIEGNHSGFPTATVAQKATAALAGWRVVLDPSHWADHFPPWVLRDPGGHALNRYVNEISGWSAAWALCEARAEADHNKVGYEPKGSWFAGGWETFRQQQRKNGLHPDG